MRPVRIIFVGLVCGGIAVARADVPSVQYVQDLIETLNIPTSAADIGAVPTSRTVNGESLDANVTLDGADIALTGYSKPNATSAVAAADTINAAIGKLEKGLEGKQDTIPANTYDAYGAAAGLVGTLSNLTTTDKTSVVAAINEVKSSLSNIDTGVASVTEGATNGTVAVDGTDVAVHGLGNAAYKGVAASIADNETGLTTGDQVFDALAGKVSTSTTVNGNALSSNVTLDGADIALTGYSKPNATSAVAATDTINQAVGKIEAALSGFVPTSRTVNGNALSSDVTLTGANVSLTGYSKPNATSAVAATDTINAAIGKIEAALDGKQASGSYVPTTTTVNGHALSGNVTVSKSDVGLGNVANVDTTNAANISSGTMDVARLPVGTTSTTVAAGDDARFDSISTTQPSGTPPTGRVWVWFN